MLTPERLDRAQGVMVALAAGDALGAPYEFHPPLGPDDPVGMVGGGSLGWDRGEWTDDTSMAIVLAQVAALGTDLRTVEAQDAIVARWWEWARSAKDVGIQTRSVLGSAARGGRITAAGTLAASADEHRRTGRTAGNGSLMRTSPVALARLNVEPNLAAEDLAETARAISSLTHFDPEAGDACVLWCLAIRKAVLSGELDVRVGLDLLPAARRDLWAARIQSAETHSPADFANNGWVVAALQAAWSAIVTTRSGPDGGHLPRALDSAVRSGWDTDTVAAIAGSLLGAAYGASSVPQEWTRLLHGWPGLHAGDLVELATRLVA